MAAPRASLLPATLMERLERLSLLARRPVKGWSAGQRRSRKTGHSVEFADYRPYGQGDDLRYVDWNIYARTQRMVVKLFVDDEELCLHLLLDASASMTLGTPSKLDWAAQLAASLGFVGLTGLERVGLGVMRDQVAEGWAPARGRARIPPLMDFLGKLRGEGRTSLNEALSRYAAMQPGGGVAVLMSDLLDPSGFQPGLRALQERGFEVHVIHVLSPEDLDPGSDPTLRGELRLIDRETGEARALRIDEQALAGYRERLAQFLADAEQFCRSHAIGYHRASTASSVESLVMGSLRGRLLD